jgi:peptidoglycan/LPS O-acetylase OafA/YrhL
MSGMHSVAIKTNNFDFLRLLAASQVMLLHSTEHLYAVHTLMHKLLNPFPGVPIFFVISGFLISASYKRSPNLKIYAQNRILRIFPGLWCCVLATVIVVLVFGIHFNLVQLLPWILAQLAGVIYTPPFLNEFGIGSYNGSLWTIPVELQFYVLLPVLLGVSQKMKKPRFWLWVAWCLFFIIGFSFRYIVPQTDIYTYYPWLKKVIKVSFLPHFYMFLTGVLLQEYEVFNSKYVSGKALCWLAAYLTILALPLPSVFGIVKMLVLSVVVVSFAYTHPTLSHSILGGNDISYGTYIYHGLYINIFLSIGLTGNFGYLFLLWLLSYLTAFLSWTVVEKPFLRMKKQTINPELLRLVISTASEQRG